MSDPFSVVGTAVGITSLGIQVCQGLVYYLQTIQGGNQDIADYLRETQTLLSIFNSLNNILPKLDQSNPPGSSAIRTCLQDCQEKLQQLKQFLMKLRGPQQRVGPTQKIKEAARQAIYPFREGKVTSLRDSVRSLLNNLNLAIVITSLYGLSFAHHDEIETFEADIQRLGAESEAQHNSLIALAQNNSDQIRLLEQSVADSLDKIKQRLDQTELTVRDLSEDFSAKLTVIENLVASGTHFAAGSMTQISENHDLQMALLSRLNLQMSRIQEGFHQKGPSFALLSRVPHGAGLPNVSRRMTMSIIYVLVYILEIRVSNRTVQAGETQSRLQAVWSRREHPTNRQSTTSVEADVVVETNDPCQYRVQHGHQQPWDLDTLQKRRTMLEQPGIYGYTENGGLDELQSTERIIISLYQDKEASQHDRDEHGRSHFTMLVGIVIGGPSQRLWLDDLVFPEVLKVLKTLQVASYAGDETLINSVSFKSDPSLILMQDESNGLTLLSWLASYLGVESPLIRGWVHPKLRSNLAAAVDVVDAMDVPPIGRAILLKSLINLEKCISRNPQSPMDFVLGLTTIQLAVDWPQGLERLLKTKARHYIDDDHAKCKTPLHRAANSRHTDSVELLIKAGCRFGLNDVGGMGVHPDSVDPMAAELARRRRELLALAQQQLGTLKHLDPSDVEEADSRAASLCQDLDEAGVLVPPALRVEQDYKTIYYCPEVDAAKFPVFFRHGFRSWNSHDNIGLTPIMKYGLGSMLGSSGPNILKSLLWLKEKGLFDQTPEDPLGIGLNLHATGRHYIATKIAAEIAVLISEDGSGYPHYVTISTMLTHLEKLSEERCRDNCACWCNPRDRGCSPLKSFLNAIPQYTTASRAVFAHLFIGNEFLDVQPGGTTDLFLEMVRLLTFETLEMTHTCCVLKNTNRGRLLAHCKPAQHLLQNENGLFDSDMTLFSLHLIMNRDPEETARIRSGQQEQEKAGQLHSLMEEFTPVVHAVYSSRGTFVPFLWGYWRRRISELFAVDKDMVGEMKQSLNNVETHVLPDRVRIFLGHNFNLLTGCGSQTPEDWEEWRDLEWKLDERPQAFKLAKSATENDLWVPHAACHGFAVEEHISAAPRQEQVNDFHAISHIIHEHFLCKALVASLSDFQGGSIPHID
ncbi:hypothetical protein FDECE_16549 [Fusarium decemcellulare]|nr:hypothetical protein FDECE_16549 [Fusarium decemcellulare]